ncbi:MAG: cytochrome c [Yoonia sp.]|nr:cytochrome c [Yoonia sp.]
MSTASVVLGLGVTAFWFVQNDAAQAQVPLQPVASDIVAGEMLYATSCASCHGANLEGQADWRSPGDDGKLPAPPHDKDGHTWHHGDALLFNYTKLGGKAALAEQGMDFNSGMPGFSDSLTDAEIWNILGYIKSTWPERMRETQASRTKSEQLQGALE